MAIQLSGSLAITGSLVATSQIVAQTLNVQQVTSSIVYSSGSNIFGNSVSNTQQFTGSLQVSGSTSYILGNVGIGTSSPSAKLHIGESGAAAQLWLQRTDGYNPVKLIGGTLADGNGFKITMNTTDIFAITSGGSVGIGTTSPATKLHISNNGAYGIEIDVANEIIQAYNRSTSDYNEIKFYSSNIRFFNGTSSTITERMRITSGGLVGIGTTSPLTKLHLRDGAFAIYQTSGSGASSLGGQIYLGDTNFDNSSYFNSAPGIGAVYSSDTSVAGDLAFYVYTGVSNSRTERVRILQNGRVGIGTTSPTTLLHLQNSSGPTIRLVRSSNRFDITGDTDFMELNARDASTYMIFKTADTERMRITAGGNIGIGTTSPSAKLHVEGTFINNGTTGDVAYISSTFATSATNGRVLHIRDNKAAVGTDSYVSIGWTSSPGQDVYIGKRTTSSAGFLAIQNSSATELLTINLSSANVGIGTTSPSYKTEIAGAIGEYWNGSAFTGTPLALAISNTTAGGYDPVLLYRQTDSGGTTKLAGGIGLVGTGPWTAGDNGSQSSDMYFLVRNGSGGISERMRIKSDGNVGIGTSTINSKLEIVGGHIKVVGSSAYIGFGASNGTTGFTAGLGVTATAQQYEIYDNSAGSTRLFIKSDGNVGIGTTSPAGKLDIRGSGNNYSLFIIQGASGSGAGAYFENTSALALSSARMYLDNLDNFVIARGGGTDRIGLAVSASGAIGINTLPTSTARLTVSGSSSVVNFQGSGSNIFTVDGTSGRLFSVDDDLTNSLFSVNTIAGLPVIEAFADNTVKLGKYSAASGSVMNITGSYVGIGTSVPAAALHVVGNQYTSKASGGGTFKQVVVGQTTAASSGVAKKIAYVGFTHSVRVYIWANQSTAHGSSAIADICTVYGSSNGGTVVESNYGNVTDISVAYNNGGSPAYTIDISVTYSGTAPTINYVIEGISWDNNIYTL